MMNSQIDLDGLNELGTRISLTFESGRIMLDRQRMILLHTGAVAALRKELLDTLGIYRARGVLTRMGYASGNQDARMARELMPDASDHELLLMGPRMHSLEGIVSVKPIQWDIDIPNGHYYGEFLWENSHEAEAHQHAFGLHTEPVCWSQIGYASGYTSEIMGRFVAYREVECRGCGDKHCRIIGKPLEEWEDPEEEQRYYRPDALAEQLFELQKTVEQLRYSLDEQVVIGDMVGNSESFRATCEMLRKAASSHVTVLLLGETGVGKEMCARALHSISGRAQATFVAVNCAAIPEELIESELFGVEKGAFTGAQKSRPGRFERAHGGTLFLDEIGELSLTAQAKLLRVLQEGEIERLGDTGTRKVDVRVVAATNRDLQEAVAEGRFRQDLFYRLSIYPVIIPPLRQRIDDIPLLVDRFVEKYAARDSKRVPGVTLQALQALQRHAWPGNVRELENMIERGVILVESGHEIDIPQLFPQLGLSAATPHPCMGDGDALNAITERALNEGLSLDSIEASLLERAVELAGGNLSAAARQLGMSRPQLAYRLKKREESLATQPYAG